LPTLARAIREYRTDTITIPTEARRQAFEQHADPRSRARVRELVDAHEIHARMKRNIDEAERAHFALVEQMKKLGPLAAISDKVRQSSTTLSRLWTEYLAFLFESGLLPKAPTVHHVLAAQIVIKDEKDAGQVLQALIDFMNRAQDVHPFLPGAVAGVQRMLEGPKPVEPDHEALIEARRRHADEAIARMEARIAELTVQPPEPEDDEPRVPIDEPEYERIEGMLPPPRGRVIDVEVDDMPALEEIW
jgi:hypothetical protein